MYNPIIIPVVIHKHNMHSNLLVEGQLLKEACQQANSPPLQQILCHLDLGIASSNGNDSVIGVWKRFINSDSGAWLGPNFTNSGSSLANDGSGSLKIDQ